MKILVVDDDPVIRDLVPTILREKDHYDISVASSGTKALDMLLVSDEDFDIFVLDIEMPEMDGTTLCAKIRALPQYHSTPIIMLTAKSDTYHIEGAFSAGANDYITKPFDIKDIGRRIQTAERMMREGCKIVLHETLVTRFPTPSDSHEFDVTDPLRISGLAQHTDPFSLGNYLSQLSRARVDKTSAFAFQVNDFDELHNEHSCRDMALVLAEVSDAISHAANDKRLLDAYFGSGAFICIATDDLLGKWPPMENAVNAYLGNSEPLQSIGVGQAISVIMSRPFRPNASKTNRVRPTFDRALSQLDRRIRLNLASS